MKVVFDTNVFIAAALRGGFAEDLIELSAKDQIRLLTSEEILTELRQKLLSKFAWTAERVDFFIARIRMTSEIIKIKEKIDVITRDPKDNKILECALSGNANIIVTSDQDLIRLKVFKGIAIIHPRTFAWTFPQDIKKKQKQ